MPFLRKYNTLTVTGTTAIRVPMIKRAVVDFAVSADWTPATGDVKILVDGTAAANVTNLPTAIATANTGTVWEFVLTAAELSCKQCEVVISDAATKAVEDQSFIVETFGNASAMYQADLSLPNLPANMTQILGTAVATPATAGLLDVNVKQISTDATAADNAESFFDGTGYAGTNNVIPLVTTATNLTNVPSGSPTDTQIAAAVLAVSCMRTGTAQAGAATTITLDASASAVDSYYVGALIFLTGGTGAGQFRTITAYVGSTKAATVATWSTNPSSSSVFVIQPAPTSLSGAVGSVTGAVGSVTATVNADVKKVNAVTVTGAGTALDPWGP